MSKSTEKTMIDIPAALGMKQQEVKRAELSGIKKYLWLVAGIIVILLVIFVKSGAISEGNIFKDYLTAGEVSAIVEARYVGGHNKYYNYVVMAEDELVSVKKQGYVSDFIVTNVLYGNSVSMGSFTIENEVPTYCQEGKTYLLILYEGGMFLTDFYPIESPQSETMKESRFSTAPTDKFLIEKSETGWYILSDGSRISQDKMAQELNKLMESLVAGER